MYGGGEPPVRNGKKVGSSNRELSSPLSPTGKEKRKAVTHSVDGEKDGVRKVETREVETKLDEEKVTMVSTEMETKNNKKGENRTE